MQRWLGLLFLWWWSCCCCCCCCEASANTEQYPQPCNCILKDFSNKRLFKKYNSEKSFSKTLFLSNLKWLFKVALKQQHQHHKELLKCKFCFNPNLLNQKLWLWGPAIYILISPPGDSTHTKIWELLSWRVMTFRLESPGNLIKM